MFTLRRPIDLLSHVEVPLVVLATFVTLIAFGARLGDLSLLVVAIALLILVLAADARAARRALARTEGAADAATRALDHMGQGIVVVDRDGLVTVINDRAIEMLELPARFSEPNQPFAEIVDFMVARGEFAPLSERRRDRGASNGELRAGQLRRVHTLAAGLDYDVYERKRPDGTVLTVESRRMPDGGFVRVVTDTTERHRSAENLWRMARHDALTSLPNRQAFHERIGDCLATRNVTGGFTLMFIDIDGFKLINDSHGHPVGDRFLRAVAVRLAQSIRSGDHIARIAGDEFAVILAGLTDPAIALARARQMVNAMCEPVVIDNCVIAATVSIGVALCPRDGVDADTLARSTDIALHNAKTEGRNTCRLFAHEMAERFTARHRIERDLARAILDDQLAVYYQPLVSLRDGRIVGCEALLRWNHPERGPVSPSEFIPIAEETGLIIAIGRWALNRACADAARWKGGGRVAVNLSAVQFRTLSLVDDIREALDASGLDPARLELEVTETALLHGTERTIAQLRELDTLGLSIAMDDFGTGYSSLNYLREFAFDRIKIDRSFIAELGRGREGDSIVEAIVSLARCLGVATTAEGVETVEQHEALRAMGCDEAQGFLFSRPRPAADIEELLGARVLVDCGSAAGAPSFDLRRDEHRLPE